MKKNTVPKPKNKTAKLYSFETMIVENGQIFRPTIRAENETRARAKILENRPGATIHKCEKI